MNHSMKNATQTLTVNMVSFMDHQLMLRTALGMTPVPQTKQRRRKATLTMNMMSLADHQLMFRTTFRRKAEMKMVDLWFFTKGAIPLLKTKVK